MSSRHLIVLGTSSQAPTRLRAHNGYVMRWDDQLVLFDPGEGTQRQAIFADISIARLTGICITHFHGDHCLGLPGVIQRRNLDSANSTDGQLSPLPVLFPGEDVQYFERLRTASIFHDSAGLVPHRVTGKGVTHQRSLGSLEVFAAPLHHRVTTYGYRLQAPPRPKVDPKALDHYQISGPAVSRLIDQGWLDTDNGRVELSDVATIVAGQAMAFIMDTAPCQAIVDLARNADLAVFESTFLTSEADLAEKYQHLTAAQAAQLAAQAGVRRLVLAHFSARYPNNEVFAEEASQFHDDVVAADDLGTVDMPNQSLAPR